MKDASSRLGSAPVSEPGGVILRRLRPEPTPTLAGLPGLPWHPLLPTLDEMLAASRPSALVRRAYDPLGQGWPRVQPAISYQPIPAPPLLPRTSRARSRKRSIPRSAVAQDPGALSVPDVAISEPSNVRSGAPAAELASTDTAPRSAPAAAKGTQRRIELIPAAPSLPRILFTGDEPLLATDSSDAPGQPKSLGVPAEPTASASPVSVPEGMGHVPAWADRAAYDLAVEVRLIARDPFTVVAHWDREPMVLEASEEEWGRGRWWMRLHQGSAEGPVITERPAQETSGTVLLPVIEPGRSYVAELGYDSYRSGWHGVAISHPTPTPRDRPVSSPAVDAPLQWGTVAPWEGEPGAGGGVGYVPSPTADQETDNETVGAPDASSGSPLSWSWSWWRGDGLESSATLTGDDAKPGTDGTRRVRRPGKPGQPELVELSRSIASEALAEILPPEARRAFWFRVNAEVILHGSTEPDARVTIAGRPVALRPDGSFSFRFAFPDGDFRLPVVAVSADRQDGRQATVRFLRSTGFEGEVGEHPVSPAWDADLGEWGK